MCSGGAMIVSLAIRRLDHAPSQPGHATTLGKHFEKPPTSPARHRIGSTCRAVGGLRMPARIPAVRSGPPRRSRRPRYLAALLACALAATIVAGLGAVGATASPLPAPSSTALPVSSCPGGSPDPSWTLSTTTFDPVFYRHAFVGNGYFAQRVPPTGMGYVATGEKTGWPLYTPRYDGAFVGGLYAQDPNLAGDRQVIAAIPTWSTLTVGAGTETYTATTPAARVSNYQQALQLRCGLLSTALTWTTSDGRSTDLAYDVVADRVHPHVGAVRLRMTPHWNGRATVTDL